MSVQNNDSKRWSSSNAINVLQMLGKHGTVVLHGRGETITSAVTIANIVTERLLKGNSKVDSILLSSDVPKTMGRMISTIQITLKKS